MNMFKQTFRIISADFDGVFWEEIATCHAMVVVSQRAEGTLKAFQNILPS